MGLKEKMMEQMMGKMSAEEKKDMMNAMMDQFFGSMSDQEKQDLMKEMMGQMMGGKGGSMMSMMMGGAGSGNQAEPGDGGMEANPMDMCKKMMGSMSKTTELAVYSTPEIQALFQEWLAQIEAEVVTFLQEHPKAPVKQLCDHFHLTKESMLYILTKLALKDKVEISLT